MRAHISLLMVFGMLSGLLSSSAWSEPLMTKEKYIEYSVQYRCINQKFHDDLSKKEDALIQLDDTFGLNDDNFDAFDELVTEYERDAQVLDTIIARTREQCAVQ